jgi:hypothetical protein
VPAKTKFAGIKEDASETEGGDEDEHAADDDLSFDCKVTLDSRKLWLKQ